MKRGERNLGKVKHEEFYERDFDKVNKVNKVKHKTVDSIFRQKNIAHLNMELRYFYRR